MTAVRFHVCAAYIVLLTLPQGAPRGSTMYEERDR